MSPILRLATTDADFAALQDLRMRMSGWDVRMSAAYGVTEAVILSAYYSTPASALATEFTAPGAAMILAWQGDAPLGSLGFSRWQGETAEIRYVFVDEAARGQGLGRALMERTVPLMKAAGYRRAVLETAPFMTSAIALYRRHGFTDCAPFRASPPGLGPASLFMEMTLQDRQDAAPQASGREG